MTTRTSKEKEELGEILAIVVGALLGIVLVFGVLAAPDQVWHRWIEPAIWLVTFVGGIGFVIVSLMTLNLGLKR